MDRCTSALSTSKLEIESLEKQLQTKIEETIQLKDDENNALVEVAHYKEECQRLNGKLNLLDSELKYGDALEHQKKRLEEFQDQIDDLQKINDDLNDECVKLRLSNEQLVKENQTVNDKYNEMVQTNEDLKRLLATKSNERNSECEKLKEQLEDAHKQCYELKNKYIEVSEAKDRIIEELSQLRQSETARKQEEDARNALKKGTT